jgi:hypothetical protein
MLQRPLVRDFALNTAPPWASRWRDNRLACWPLPTMDAGGATNLQDGGQPGGAAASVLRAALAGRSCTAIVSA